MTRKDYEYIAAVIHRAMTEALKPSDYVQPEEDVVTSIAMDFASGLATDNPRFDRARFLKACGVAEG